MTVSPDIIILDSMKAKNQPSDLGQIIEALIKKTSLNNLYEIITQKACSFFDGQASSLMLLDNVGEYLTINRSCRLSTEFLQVYRIHIDQGIAGKVCREKAPLIINNIHKLSVDVEGDPTLPFIKKAGIQSMICAPLLVGAELIGCLNIYYTRHKETFENKDNLEFFMKLCALAIEHHRLLDESETKTRVFRVLGDIALHITASFNLNEILKIFLSTAMEITDTDVSGMYLINRDTLVVQDAYEYNMKERTLKKYRSAVRLDQSNWAGVFETKKPIIIDDLSKYPNIKPLSQKGKAAALAGLPLVVKGNNIGILYVESENSRRFLEEEIEYLSILCNYASVAIENSKLYEKLAREAEQASILYDVGQSFISTLNFDQLLANILKRLTHSFGHLNLALFLLDQETNELKLRAYINYPDDVRNLRIKIGEAGITGHVAATKQVYYAADVSADPHYIKGVGDARSEVGLPLIIGDKLIGVLDVESPEPNRFSEEDIYLLATLSNQIAIAMENSRLYEETKKLSLTDPLTVLPNRRSFKLFIDSEIKRAERFHRFFAVFMIDFDNFKNYNDRYGHPAGDIILRKFSKLMKKAIRDVDFLGRYGGDEFVAVLSETDKLQAREVAERMRKVVAEQNLEPHVTLSIGIAAFPDNGDNVEDLIDRADRACYDAKQLGGNRINFSAGTT